MPVDKKSLSVLQDRQGNAAAAQSAGGLRVAAKLEGSKSTFLMRLVEIGLPRPVIE